MSPGSPNPERRGFTNIVNGVKASTMEHDRPRWRFRLTVGSMMVFVVVASLNLAAARALFAQSLLLFAAEAPVGLAMQFGLYRLIRSRGRSRRFWDGFVVVGFIAMLCSYGGLVNCLISKWNN
jgi:hypothetical protein